MKDNTDSKDKNYQKAKLAWKDLVKVDSQRYVQIKVMNCLPKHKVKLHNKILGQILRRRYRVLETFDKAFKKLDLVQQATLRSEVYL